MAKNDKEEFKEFESNTLKDFTEVQFNPLPVPWINAPQINQDISIEV